MLIHESAGLSWSFTTPKLKVLYVLVLGDKALLMISKSAIHGRIKSYQVLPTENFAKLFQAVGQRCLQSQDLTLRTCILRTSARLDVQILWKKKGVDVKTVYICVDIFQRHDIMCASPCKPHIISTISSDCNQTALWYSRNIRNCPIICIQYTMWTNHLAYV